MQPRTQPYQMAHRLLRDDVHRHPAETWRILSGPEAGDYLQMHWQGADVLGEQIPAQGLRVVGLRQHAGWELLAIELPAPQAPTEAFFVILARRPQAAFDVGYFVAERGVTSPGEESRAYVAEWRRDGSRIRMGDLPAISPDAFADYVISEVAGRATPAFTPLGQTSMAPTAVGPRIAPKKSHGGKVAAGIAAVLVLGVGGLMVKRHFDQQAFLAAYEEEQAAIVTARDAVKERVETAESRIQSWKDHRAACVSSERERASGSVDAAELGRVSIKRPSDGAALEGALPITSVDGKVRPLSRRSWLPTTSWIGGATACEPLPKAVGELEKVLGDDPGSYGHGSDYIHELEGFEAQVAAAIDELGEPPEEAEDQASVFVVVEERCSSRAIAHFTGTTGRMSLERSTCRPRLVWIDGEGEVLAAITGVGAANPTDPGLHTNGAELRRFNTAARGAALAEAGAKMSMTLKAWR